MEKSRGGCYDPDGMSFREQRYISLKVEEFSRDPSPTTRPMGKNMMSPGLELLGIRVEESRDGL